MVLGEKLWEEKGNVVGFSVKSIGPEGVRIEQTFACAAKGFGRSQSGTNMGTLEFVWTPDHFMSGGGQGIFTTQDGEIVTWKAYFFGKVEGDKGRSFSVIKFMTTSPKLAWMNGVIAAAEGITDDKTTELTDTGYECK